MKRIAPAASSLGPAGAGSADRSIRRHFIAVAAALLVLIGAIGGWMVSTELMGAVIAPGQLVVESNARKIQHPTGGVVGAIFARDGDRVTAGDILVRLDDTQTRANLAIIVKSLNELAAREARQIAERDARPSIAFPQELLVQQSDLEVARLIDGEQRLFENRVKMREGQKSQLRQQVEQAGERIVGLSAQLNAKAQEIEWNRKELAGIRDLWSKNLIPFTRVSSLERDGARLAGESGQLVAATAETKGRISEIELRIIQIDQDMRAEIDRDLAEIRAKRSELTEKRVAAEDSLKRIDIRSPIDGRVHQSVVHTVGGVVPSTEPLMLIVPTNDVLVAESRVSPSDVDQLQIGQDAVIQLGAFNQRTTPRLNGRVIQISPDVSVDQKSGAAFYSVRVSIPKSEVERLGAVRLVPGMPLVLFMQTDMRTVLSYLVRPLQEQVDRAFRER